MASELELKAAVSDPATLREALARAGAREAFRGMLRDRRLDRAGELTTGDQILRVRQWLSSESDQRAVLGWKGPPSISADGYKHSEERECGVNDAAKALAVFQALGYEVVHAIDRYVEVYELHEAVARLEWYPRMDVLVEIEGTPAGIERLIAAVGLAREACLPEALTAFAARFESRTGRPAVLAEADLVGEPPSWRVT